MNKSKKFQIGSIRRIAIHEELKEEWKKGGVEEQIEYSILIAKNSKAILKQRICWKPPGCGKSPGKWDEEPGSESATKSTNTGEN